MEIRQTIFHQNEINKSVLTVGDTYVASILVTNISKCYEEHLDVVAIFELDVQLSWTVE